MRTALLLLLLLAVAAVPGSVFPQRRIDPARVDAVPARAPGLRRRGSTGSASSTSTRRSGSRPSTCCSSCRWSAACCHARGRTSRRCGRRRRARPRRLDAAARHTHGWSSTGRPERSLDAAAASPAPSPLPRRRGTTTPASPPSAATSPRPGTSSSTSRCSACSSPSPSGRCWATPARCSWSRGRRSRTPLPYYDSFTAGPRVDRGNLAPFSLTLDRHARALRGQGHRQPVRRAPRVRRRPHRPRRARRGPAAGHDPPERAARLAAASASSSSATATPR